ncbi:hypothetical protein LIER_00820 [Lithospermum erythrorhizon]|uniref:Transmembrane protein n=1 Tax=Lithospermum erythrorhizon TaxID=34254 RepID=A0AAV3NN84_LITER
MHLANKDLLLLLKEAILWELRRKMKDKEQGEWNWGVLVEFGSVWRWVKDGDNVGFVCWVVVRLRGYCLVRKLIIALISCCGGGSGAGDGWTVALG